MRQPEVVAQFMHECAGLHLCAPHLVVGGNIGPPQTERDHDAFPAGRRRPMCSWARAASGLPLQVERAGHGMSKEHVMEDTSAVLREVRGMFKK